MFPWNPNQWTEPYLNSLIGQPESCRLEFKSGKALAKKEQKDKFMRDRLSPAVSAFANSEGGIIVIGMDEDRDTKPRVASQLDGIAIGADNAIDSPEQFQQMVDSCISPFLPGLAVRRVPLSGDLQGRVVMIVHVPQGSTAYQARDHLYYSRSEFETKSMPDHEVRLRMQRGRTPQARLELASRQCISADQEFQRRLTTKEHLAAKVKLGEVVLYGHGGTPSHEELEAPKRDFNEYEFQFAVVNTGELTIRDFVLAVRVVSHGAQLTFVGKQIPEIDVETRFRFLRETVTETITRTPKEKLFPGDRVLFPDPRCQRWLLRFRGAGALKAEQLLAEWTIFLDDAVPTRGTVDLGLALQGFALSENGD
jgi:hypothetical protein